MGPLDFAIIAAVAAVLALCIRSLMRGKDKCAGCASGSGCSAKGDPAGSCSAAQRMLDHANEALKRDATTPSR